MTQSIDWNDDGFLDIDECYAKVRQLRGDLTRIRVELKGLRGANREYAHQLASVKSNREYWYEEAQAAEAERARALNERDEAKNEAAFANQAAQEQSEMVQRDWLSPCQKAGLEQKPERASAGEAAKALVSKLKVRQLHLRACGQELFCKTKLTALWEALEYRSEAAAKLLDRLATLDAAETALAECGLTGIYDDFSGPADAIEQLVKRLVQLEGGQALQAERQLRREAERVCEAVSEMARNWGGRLEKAEQRAERAEALAAPVNEETAELLERLAGYARLAAHAAKGTPDDVDEAYNDEEIARALAASIREALEANNESA